jgi:hypothetical protein
MSKVRLITTKGAPTWESWQDLKGRKMPDKVRTTMTQREAIAIFQEVIAAPSLDDAVQILKTALPSRKVFTYWLGQIGHRQDARLGKGKGFAGYVKAVVESFCNRGTVHDISSEGKEYKEMGTKDEKPDVVIRKSKAGNRSSEPAKSGEENAAQVDEKIGRSTRNDELGLVLNGPKKARTSESNDVPMSNIPSAETPAMSRVQLYALRNLLVFADCAVQKDESGVFDTLARNFEDKGLLNFWLWKVGYGYLSKKTRNKDLVDSMRILSRELYREMKQNVGRPVARW